MALDLVNDTIFQELDDNLSIFSAALDENASGYSFTNPELKSTDQMESKTKKKSSYDIS